MESVCTGNPRTVGSNPTLSASLNGAVGRPSGPRRSGGQQAALRLVDNGTIGLDADVNDYSTSWQVPDNAYTAGEKVTLRRLLDRAASFPMQGR